MNRADRSERLERLHARLRALGTTVAVAESLTGGLLCAALTETAGASDTMRGGFVVYATELKARLAGVDADLLERVGAVHPEVAVQLAEGVRVRCGAGLGIGITGVAGPTEQDGRPVGTVFVAVAGERGTDVRAYALDGDRAAIRTAAVDAALELLERSLEAG